MPLQLTGRPVVLVGHSMGAGAVTRWAAGNPRAGATVAISLPSAEDLPADPARPANLLLLWGSAEQARFVEAALAGLRLGYPQAEAGTEYGDRAAGTARRAQEIAGAEHISVIYRQQTYDEVAAWVAPAGSRAQPRGDARIPGLLLVLVGGLLATRPILATGSAQAPPRAGGPQGAEPTTRATAAPRAGGRISAEPTTPDMTPLPTTGSDTVAPRSGRALLGFGAAAVGGGLGAMLLTGPTEQIPVAVAGYLLAWFACAALVLGLFAGVRPPWGSLNGLLRGIGAGAVLCLAMALPARVTWAAYHLAGVRVWVFLALLGVLGAWFHGESRLLSGARGWRRAGLLASSRVLVVAGLLGAVGVLGAPGFLLLTVPLVVPILALLAVVSGWARDPLAAAAAQGLPLALVIATTFPILA